MLCIKIVGAERGDGRSVAINWRALSASGALVKGALFLFYNLPEVVSLAEQTLDSDHSGWVRIEALQGH